MDFFLQLTALTWVHALQRSTGLWNGCRCCQTSMSSLWSRRLRWAESKALSGNEQGQESNIKTKLCKLSTLLSKAWSIALLFCGVGPTINVSLWREGRGVALANRHQWTPHSSQCWKHAWKCLPKRRSASSGIYSALPCLWSICLFFPWFDNVLGIRFSQTHYYDQILVLFLWSFPPRKSHCSYLKLLGLV